MIRPTPLAKKGYKGIADYLKREHPEYLERLKSEYDASGERSRGLSLENFLSEISLKMNPKARTKLLQMDSAIVSEEELQGLERAVESSEKLQSSVRRYGDVQTLGQYLPESGKEFLENEVIGEMHQHLTPKDRRTYSKARLSVVMRKLNIGPWTQYDGIGNYNTPEEVLRRNTDLFQGKLEGLAVKILGRVYEQKIQGASKIEDAKLILDKERRRLQNE